MNDSEDNLLEQQEDLGSNLHWYTLRTLLDEERSVTLLKMNIAYLGLDKRIVDIKYIREYQIVESEDYSPYSDSLPKTGFRTTKKTAWAKLSNGNYRKIKIVEKRPFKGNIFIKMEHDLELFKVVKSWNNSFFFLGAPNPVPMTDEKLNQMTNTISDQLPSIKDYISENNYLLVEGRISSFKDIQVDEKQDAEEEHPIDESVTHVLTEEELKAQKKAEIYSDLQIKEYEDTFVVPKSKSSKTKSKKGQQMFKVNDLVFIQHLGFKGIVQEIDYGKNYAVIGVQMFGRRQPVECKISEISPI